MSVGKVDLADSNIANLGSKENHQLRYNTACKEQAWTDAGKKVGVQVWRIEQFKVVPWPTNKYGQFFSGDAYIVLNTYKADPKSEKLSYNVHFWLGAQSTQDEQGTAAYKTVELDDYLGETPVEFREVQDFETDAFLALFPHLVLLQGGVASGFSVVEPTKYTPRLLHLHGDRKFVRLSEVPLNVSSLDDTDVFVLDAGLSIWQWNGSASNVAEKRKADSVVLSVVEERQGKPKKAVLDGLEKCDEFWKLLGCAGGNPPAAVVKKDSAAASVAAAAQAAQKAAQPTKLWKLSDASGSLSLTKVGEGATAKKSLLNSDDVFLADTGLALFVYVGKKASHGEKQNAVAYATSYLKQFGTGRENHTPISRVIEGGHSAAFEAVFAK